MPDETKVWRLDTLSSAELVPIACGPWRSGTDPPELAEALAAIQILANRARTDGGSVEALRRVIESTTWWETTEGALDQFLAVASVNQLQELAHWLYDLFWEPGEYGGGLATPWRLRRVVDRLGECGVSLEDAVLDIPSARLRELLELASQYEELFVRAGSQ